MAESLIPQVDFNRETIDMSVYHDSERLFSAASRHAEAWVSDRIADPFKGAVDPLRANAVSRATGLFLGLYVEHAEEPSQLMTTTKAMGQWLADPLSNVPQHKKYPLPTAEINHSLFDKVIEAGWINNYDTLVPIAASVEQLAMLKKDASPAAKLFAKNMKTHISNDLRWSADDPKLREKIVLFSALTDVGVVNEDMWGKVGIGIFSPETPLAITEEVHRRYVTERRDALGPITEKALLGIMGKYALNVLEQAALSGNRRRDVVEDAVARLTLGATEQSMIIPEKIGAAVINYSNEKTLFGANGPGELLERDTLLTGKALARILRMTRYDDTGSEAYSDSLHTEIMHEMATTDLGAIKAARQGLFGRPILNPEG